MECDGQAPGFYGKLPSHGDFVGRRLPPDVRDCFDRWLQAALMQSRADLGTAWLPTWGSSPLWRFVVGAGVCGEQAWAGVMMPSADRVGRCFPLLLAAGVDGTPSLRDCLTRHAGWFARLEDFALSTLEAGFSLEAFDAGLQVLDGAPRGLIRDSCTGPAVRAVVGACFAPLAGEGLPALADDVLDGQSAWWCEGAPLVAPALAVCSGMPAPSAFAALIDGRWTERGWASTLPRGASIVNGGLHAI